MLNKWLENDPKVTLVCAATSAVSLALSLTGALRAALPADIAWLAIVLCGTPILVGAFRGVVFEGDIKADLLVSLALIASAATGEYFAAGEVALIMQIGSLLEDYTSGKARESIEKLIRITPRMARVLRNGEETTVPAEEVVPGDALRVLVEGENRFLVRELKEEEGCDIVIVSLHWGRETYTTQSSGQVTMAKQLLDGGADVIYGHHPHVLQPMMFYQGKPIMFSTGNFTFGTMSKVDPHTGIFRFTYRKTEDRVLLSGIEVIPCQTSGGGDYRPYVLTDETEIGKTFRLLTAKNVPAKCENPPEYFLDTGRIMFDDTGMSIP